MEFVNDNGAAVDNLFAWQSDTGSHTHSLSKFGYLIATNVGDPLRVQVLDIPTVEKNGKHLELLRFETYDERNELANYKTFSEELRDNSKVDRYLPYFTRFNANRKQWEQALVIYAIKGAGEYLSSGNFKLQLTDSSAAGNQFTLNVPFNFREIDIGDSVVFPTDNIGCGGIDLSGEVNLFSGSGVIKVNHPKTKVNEVYTSEHLLNYISNIDRAGQRYTLQWVFNKGIRPYTITTEVTHFLIGNDSSTNVKTDGINVIEVLNSGLVPSTDINKDIYELEFQTISTDINVNQNYIGHLFIVNLRDSCHEVNSYTQFIRVFFKTRDTDLDCSQLVLNPTTLIFEGTESKSFTISTTRNFTVRLLSSPSMFTLLQNVVNRPTITAIITPERVAFSFGSMREFSEVVEVKDLANGAKNYDCIKFVELKVKSLLYVGAVMYLGNRQGHIFISNDTSKTYISQYWSEAFLNSEYGDEPVEHLLSSIQNRYPLNVETTIPIDTQFRELFTIKIAGRALEGDIYLTNRDGGTPVELENVDFAWLYVGANNTAHSRTFRVYFWIVDKITGDTYETKSMLFKQLATPIVPNYEVTIRGGQRIVDKDGETIVLDVNFDPDPPNVPFSASLSTNEDRDVLNTGTDVYINDKDSVTSGLNTCLLYTSPSPRDS